MACPYFYPVARFESSSWLVSPRLPLGDAYAGECRAGASAFQPDETRLRETCNLGYGRSVCDCFPQDATADAVRFHVAKDSGGLIHIRYVFEKDCWPLQHGDLAWAETSRQLSGSENAVLKSQAAAFLESYLKRRE